MAAVRIAEAFLVPHALAAFGEMGADPAVEEARYVLRWVERRGRDAFTVRELHQDAKGRFKKVRDLDRPLALLVEHGYLRRHEAEERPGPGRKPSTTFDVNPLWHPHNPRNPQNDDGALVFGDSEDSGDVGRQGSLSASAPASPSP